MRDPSARRLPFLHPSVAPPQLAVSIHDALKRAILEGHLHPSERINQEWIARELGVSRTPVREALHSLAREGLVEFRPRRGAFVAAFDEKDASDIYELRELLEPHAAAKACVRATPAEIEALRRLEAEIERAVSDDMERAFALNREFHYRLCEPCSNRLLMTLLETVWSQQSALRIFTYYAQWEEAARRTHAQHRAIVEAFAARDPERTRGLMREHIAEAHRTLVELMAGAEEERGAA